MPLYIADFSGTRPTWTVEDGGATDSYRIITFSDGREGSRLDVDSHSGATPHGTSSSQDVIVSGEFRGRRSFFDNVRPGRYMAYCGRRFEVDAHRETRGVGFRVWLFRISRLGLDIEASWYNRCYRFGGDGDLVAEDNWGPRYNGQLWSEEYLAPVAAPPSPPRYIFEPDRPQE